jgi:hypothetical protein
MTTTNRLKTATGASRRTIASYSTYAEAERDVDWLADHGFAMERSAIVGTGLRSVEIGRERTRASAEVLPEGQRASIYAAQAARYPGFAAYQEKTERRIPVVALTLHREGDS